MQPPSARRQFKLGQQAAEIETDQIPLLVMNFIFR